MGKHHSLKDFFGPQSTMRVVGVELKYDLTFDLKAVNREIPSYLPGLVSESLERAVER